MRRFAPFLLVVAACSGSSGRDAGPQVASTDHCEYVPLPPTGGAGGSVSTGALMAGAAEGIIEAPVSTALGGYTARASFLAAAEPVDFRKVEQPGSFLPSIGVETRPRAKALALTAGDETIVMLRVDAIFADDTITADVAAALGPGFAGKVLFATTHSHSAPEQFSADSKLAVGGGIARGRNRQIMLDTLVEVANAALEARRPARVGVLYETGFDPGDTVTRDRRGENDALPGGDKKDDHLTLIRVDGTDGAPIAIVTVFGMHGTVLDADNPLMSGDAPAAIEHALQEQFDQPVVVMHLQGAGGDASPAGRGGIEPSGLAGEPFYNFARAEGVGRMATPLLLDAWNRAEALLVDELAVEAVTRSVPLGPDWRTFTVRDGALSYAPFEPERPCDGVIFDGDQIVSPIDEFNAPVGAALCGEANDAIFPSGQIWGTEGLGPYRSCLRIDVAAELLGTLLRIPFETPPICASTRTTLTAIRLGDHLLVTLPGEPVSLLADRVRELSPVPDRTIVVGYAQGHVGYLLTADDWLLGGYEPSINSWGPLEGEYIAERSAELMALALTDTREDTATDGATRLATPQLDNDVQPDDAPLAGTVPETLFGSLYVRGQAELSSAQPPPLVSRLESARFVWIGEDPIAGTPQVTLEREVAPGTWEAISRRSGRTIVDGDFLLLWTPDPLERVADEPRTHYWVVEWQAVAWDGDVEDRAGVPAGRYRFHVAGTGYMLDSDPFDVVPATLVVETSLAGDQLTVRPRYNAPAGWRLLDLEVSSNTPVPVRRGPITVEVTYTTGPDDVFTDVAISPSGEAVVTVSGEVQTVRVTDRFGNSG